MSVKNLHFLNSSVALVLCKQESLVFMASGLLRRFAEAIYNVDVNEGELQFYAV